MMQEISGAALISPTWLRVWFKLHVP